MPFKQELYNNYNDVVGVDNRGVLNGVIGVDKDNYLIDIAVSSAELKALLDSPKLRKVIAGTQVYDVVDCTVFNATGGTIRQISDRYLLEQLSIFAEKKNISTETALESNNEYIEKLAFSLKQHMINASVKNIIVDEAGNNMPYNIIALQSKLPTCSFYGTKNALVLETVDGDVIVHDMINNIGHGRFITLMSKTLGLQPKLIENLANKQAE